MNPLFAAAAALSSLVRERPYYPPCQCGRDHSRKIKWSKAVQRRRKHRAMTKAMRQMLRRR